MELETLKIISLKRLVGGAKVPADGKTAWLAVVFGVCTGARMKSGDMGDALVFAGDFIAKGLSAKGKDEKIVAGRASALMLPQAAEDMLVSDNVGDEGTFTELALKIGIKGDDKGRPVYVCEYIVKPSQTSPAEALVDRAGAEYFGAADQAKAAPAPAKAKK